MDGIGWVGLPVDDDVLKGIGDESVGDVIGCDEGFGRLEVVLEEIGKGPFGGLEMRAIRSIATEEHAEVTYI